MKKYVITGAPCSGKTSVINELEKRGFLVLKEVAREVIEERKNFLVNKREIFERQKIIFDRQLKQEQEIKKDRILFLDRGLPDTVAYCQFLLGFVPEELNYNLSKRYELVFVLDRLSFEKDGLRAETKKETEEIHSIIIYRDYGYSTIFVPIMPIEERTDFILNFLKNERKNVCNH